MILDAVMSVQAGIPYRVSVLHHPWHRQMVLTGPAGVCENTHRRSCLPIRCAEAKEAESASRLSPLPALRTLARRARASLTGRQEDELVTESKDLREALERALLADIPLARAMGLRISAWDRTTLAISAPLAPNINDKGCVFGGSLAGVMTLAGWSLVHLAADDARIDCDIYVQDSTIRYRLPVWNDFTATASLDADESFSAFLETLRVRGKARVSVRVVVADDSGNPACTLHARFVALAKATIPSGVTTDAAESGITTPA